MASGSSGPLPTSSSTPTPAGSLASRLDPFPGRWGLAQNSQVACGAASAPDTHPGSSVRTISGDQSRCASPDRHTPCWVPRPLLAWAQAMPLRPDPCGEKKPATRTEHRGSRTGKQPPGRKEAAGQGRRGAGARAQMTDGGAAVAAASGTRPILFRPFHWDRRVRLAAGPGSALSHLSPPPEGRTSGVCPAPGANGRGRPCGAEQRPALTSSGQALPCPRTAFTFPSFLVARDICCI